MAVVSGKTLLRSCRPVGVLVLKDDLVSSSCRGKSLVSFIRAGRGAVRALWVTEDRPEKRKLGGAAPRAVVSERETAKRGSTLVDVNDYLIISEVASMVMKMLRGVVEMRNRSCRASYWGMSRKQAEMHIERGLINCRFFALFSVAGSLMGSILCFLEGCFLVLQSFLHFFCSAWHRSKEGEIVIRLLIEALDMFLVGTAILLFGTGMYTLFVSAKEVKGKERLLNISGSNFFGFFPLKRRPPWMEIGSVAKAKLRIGHSVTMILQAGVLEKFKDVPVVTGLDLACFAGAVLVSSACIFLLSRLSMDTVKR